MVEAVLPEHAVATPPVPPHLSVHTDGGLIPMLMNAYVASRLLDRSLSVTVGYRVPHSFPPALLAPAGMSAVHEVNWSGTRMLHLELGDRADVQIWEYRDYTRIELAGQTFGAVAELWDEIRHRILSVLDELAVVPTTLWSFPEKRPDQRSHSVPATCWEEIRSNYPSRTAEQVDWLANLVNPAEAAGRLLLWHGPAGTGKTTAATGLMTAWHSWCDSHVISDPEQFFNDPSYLLAVAQAGGTSDLHEPMRPMNEEVPRRSKLIVCEDADEYLRSDAKQRSGPALGRLLNLTDGMLGRGSGVFVLLTTNDDVARLHPAIRRPGRCLAEVAFPAMSPTDAAAWCPEDLSPPTSDITLAELYALRDGQQRAGHQQTSGTGMYL